MQHTFRYLGHFDLAKPFIKVSDYVEAVPNTQKPISQASFSTFSARFPIDQSAIKWCSGAIMSFLSAPGEWHPFERALIEEENCAALNMRFEILCRPGVGSTPLVNEVWAEENYLKGPRKYEMRWCEEFYKRLVWSEDASDRLPPSLQGQVLATASDLLYEVRSGGQRLEGAVDVFVAYGEFLRSHLSDGTFSPNECTVSERAVDGFNRWLQNRECESQVSDDLEETELLAYHWCRLHPQLLPPAAVMWESAAG